MLVMWLDTDLIVFQNLLFRLEIEKNNFLLAGSKSRERRQVGVEALCKYTMPRIRNGNINDDHFNGKMLHDLQHGKFWAYIGRVQ